jgi:hypothetical protein
MSQAPSTVRALLAALVAVAASLAPGPTVHAQTGDAPPLPPLIEDGLLGLSCASKEAADSQDCEQWRKDYAAWEQRRRSKGFVHAPAPPVANTDAGRVRAGVNSCFELGARETPRCKRWLTELTTWYGQRQAERRATETVKSGVERTLTGEDLRTLFTGSVAFGGWPARENQFTWRFRLGGTLEVSEGGTSEGGSGSGAWRVEGNALCLSYPSFYQFQTVRRHRGCHPVIQLGAEFQVLNDDGSPHARFGLTTVGDPPADPTALASAVPPPPPFGPGSRCGDREALAAPNCRQWFAALDTWLAAERTGGRPAGGPAAAAPELAKLEAEVARLGGLSVVAGGTAPLSEVCAYPELGLQESPDCTAYLAAKARLEAAYAARPGPGSGEAGSAATYLVIGNASNRYFADAAEMKARLRELYLGDTGAWPWAGTSTPFARPVSDPAQIAFLESVLGMNDEELTAHWRRLAAISTATVPPEIGSARELIRRIARDEGAFGVVAASEAPKLPAKVRVLLRISRGE